MLILRDCTVAHGYQGRQSSAVCLLETKYVLAQYLKSNRLSCEFVIQVIAILMCSVFVLSGKSLKSNV